MPSIKNDSLKKTALGRRKITFPYLLGLLETDGSFHLLFKKDPKMPLKYRIQPEVQWSQKNVRLLYELQECLRTLQIVSKFKNNPSFKKAGRAAVVKIEGIDNCSKFLVQCVEWSKKNNLSPLYGKKKVDFMLMQRIYSLIDAGIHNTPEGRKQILDIKYKLHKAPPNIHTLPHKFFAHVPCKITPIQSGLLAREEWERRQGFPSGSSLGCADSIIKCCYKEYMEWAGLILKESVEMHPEFFSGLLEGDGCIHTPSDQARRRQPQISLITEWGGELLLYSASKYLGDEIPSCRKSRSSTIYCINRRELLNRMLIHLEKHPVHFKGEFILRFMSWCASQKPFSR